MTTDESHNPQRDEAVEPTDDATPPMHLDAHGVPDMSDEPHDELGDMAEAVLHPEHDELKKGNAWVRWGGYVVGMGLLVACVWIAVEKTNWDHVRQAEPWQAGVMLLLALGSLMTNAVIFQLTTRPFEHDDRERIGVVEWQAIMGVTALLNYLPKAGLIGRAVYLKKKHGIAYRASLLSMLILAGTTLAVYVALFGITLWRDIDMIWAVVVALGVVFGAVTAVPVALFMMRKVGVGKARPGMVLGAMLWGVARIADTFCFAGRFYIAAHILGTDVSFEHALLLSMASNFVEMVAPFGFREAIGGWFTSLVGLKISAGIAILVVDRVAMTVIVVIAGLIGMPYLHWNMKDVPLTPPAEPAEPAGR